MYYLIRALEPTRNMMGGHGFFIDLHPKIKELTHVLTQEMVDTKIDNMGRQWLDCCGYDALYDPDDPGFPDWDVEARKPHGPNVRPLFDARQIRVAWGPWGCEHICVPGNACGLDLSMSHFGGYFIDGEMLCPHNVDTWSQKTLLLLVFCSFMEDVILLSGASNNERK